MNESKMLYLTVGKEVSLSFNGTIDQLKYIRLSVNKLAELLNNGLIDEESIFCVDQVCLITKSNYRTVVNVVGGKEIQGESNSINVKIDRTQTKKRKEGKRLLTSGDFVFVVDQNQILKKSDLHSLNKKNAKKYENERI